jgi:hypothetical protein
MILTPLVVQSHHASFRLNNHACLYYCPERALAVDELWSTVYADPHTAANRNAAPNGDSASNADAHAHADPELSRAESIGDVDGA